MDRGTERLTAANPSILLLTLIFLATTLGGCAHSAREIGEQGGPPYAGSLTESLTLQIIPLTLSIVSEYIHERYNIAFEFR
jgi:hypothetical protein